MRKAAQGCSSEIKDSSVSVVEGVLWVAKGSTVPLGHSASIVSANDERLLTAHSTSTAALFSRERPFLILSEACLSHFILPVISALSIAPQSVKDNRGEC